MALIGRLCSCGRVVHGKCEHCRKFKQASTQDYRLTPADRGYDQEWRNLSKRFRQANPLCQLCESEGRTTVASEVHHKIPIRQRFDLRLTWSNLVSVCGPCHEILERQSG